MKLNCDLGESFGAWSMGNDEAIMPFIDMANIACGFHASDPFIMDKTVKLAVEHGVSIGAHPGYPDLQGFGRRAMSFSSVEITQLLVYQIGAIQAVCEANGTSLDYVKPHGALYNTMMADHSVMEAIFSALASLTQPLSLMVLANSRVAEIRKLADSYKVPVLFEAFADRTYTDDGALMPRTESGAVLHDDADIAEQVRLLVEKQQVMTNTGKLITVPADTLCVHGDNERALQSVKNIREIIDSQ